MCGDFIYCALVGLTILLILWYMGLLLRGKKDERTNHELLGQVQVPLQLPPRTDPRETL